MVSHQCGRIKEGYDAVDDHCEGHAEVADGTAKRDVLAVHVGEDLC